MGQHTFIVLLLTLNLFQQLSLAYVTGVKKKRKKKITKQQTKYDSKKSFGVLCAKGDIAVCRAHTYLLETRREI